MVDAGAFVGSDFDDRLVHNCHLHIFDAWENYGISEAYSIIVRVERAQNLSIAAVCVPTVFVHTAGGCTG